MRTEDVRETEEEKLRRQLEWLFGGYSEHDPADELRTISRYIEYLAERIDHEKVVVAVQPDLLNQFESVCLLVLDRLQLHPESVRAQVEEILRSEKIARTLALIAMLSPEQRRRLAQPTVVHAVITRFGGYWARRFGLQDEPLLQPSNLLETKIGLNRVAQILKYAATVPLLDYDSGSRDLRDHYDPSLIGKAKVLALLNVVRTQAADVEDESVRRKIEARLDELENEVRKARPRWGRIIAGVFVLFSFVADLKSVSPGVYDQIYTTIQAIISTLHEEGSVSHQQNRNRKALPAKPQPAVLPPRVEITNDVEDGEA